MAPLGTVTAAEEVQRCYRKAKQVAEPVINKMQPKDKSNEFTAEDETSSELFNEHTEEWDWVDVVGAEDTPTDNNEENYRLATSTGPIEVASGVVLQKMFELGAAAAAKASQTPSVMRACAESGIEKLVEGVGRVTVSQTVAGVLQRYPLMERCRLAFFRGRERASRQVTVASSPVIESRSRSPDQQLMDELPMFGLDDGGMEDVPLGEGDKDDGEDETEGWDEFE